MTVEESRTQIIEYWWKKAEESLASAERELEAGAYDFSINRLYYAAFYGVSALLLKKQLSFKKHAGVRAAFHQEITKRGFLENKWGKFYDQLFEDRQECDYIAFVAFDKTYTQEKLQQCKEFLVTLQQVFNETV